MITESSPYPTLLTYSALSTYLKIKPGTLRKWVMEEKLPFLKIGGKAVRFRKSDIDLWLESQNVQGGSK